MVCGVEFPRSPRVPTYAAVSRPITEPPGDSKRPRGGKSRGLRRGVGPGRGLVGEGKLWRTPTARLFSTGRIKGGKAGKGGSGSHRLHHLHRFRSAGSLKVSMRERNQFRRKPPDLPNRPGCDSENCRLGGFDEFFREPILKRSLPGRRLSVLSGQKTKQRGL